MKLLIAWLFFCIYVVESRDERWEVENGKIDGRFMYYAPSIIGQDPHVSKIDIYSDFFTTLHERDCYFMSALGITHVIVSENWSTAGTNVHDAFLNIIKSYGMQLIITYALPMHGDGESITPDKAKFDFESLMKEWTEDSRAQFRELLYGFFIPTPDTPKMSTIEVNDYYALASQLRIIATSKPSIKKTPKFIAGLPYNPKDQKLFTYNYRGISGIDFWSIDIYDPNFNVLLPQYGSQWPAEEKPPAVLFNLRVDSWDATNRVSNFPSQATNVTTTMEKILDEIQSPSIENVFVRGVILNEYSDEWWRSDLSDVGYSEEGCPNGNPFAHTPCGINTHIGILSLEFVGFFSIKDRPLAYCVEAKEAAYKIYDIWSNWTSLPFNETNRVCAELPFVFWPTARITYYFYPVVAFFGLSTVFSLFCFAVMKKPREEKERQMPESDMSAWNSLKHFHMENFAKDSESSDDIQSIN